MSRPAPRNTSGFSSNARSAARPLVLAALLALLSLASLTPTAHATKYIDRIVSGNGTNGTAQGLFGGNGVEGVAINDPTVAEGSTDPLAAATDGYVYVVDSTNHRVQVFGPDDSFKFTFGRGVKTGGDGAEVCDSSELPCTASASGDDEEGEFNSPVGIAINQATGDVYVSDASANRRIQQFEADGTFVRTWGWDVMIGGGTGFETCTVSCKAGTQGSEGGQLTFVPAFSSPIAVDPNAPHHVFIADSFNRRVQEFEADGDFVRLWGVDVVAAGQPGDTGTGFEICASTAAGICKAGTFVSFGGSPLFGDYANAITVDGADGSVYAAGGSGSGSDVQRFDSDASAATDLLKAAIPYAGMAQNKTGPSRDLDIDPDSGNLLILVSNNESSDVLELDDPAGTPTHVDTHVSLSDGSLALNHVAPDPADGELYLGTSGTGRRLLVADEDGFPLALMDVHPPLINGQQITLSGTVTPGGPLGVPTKYSFQVSKDGLSWTDVPASDNPVGDGNLPVDVEDDASLEPNRPYKVRLRTQKGFGNPAYPSAEVIDFHTEPAPPTAESVTPIGVTESSAFLTARVNPNNAATTYYFEWGTDTNYGNRFPVPAATAGSDFGSRLVTARLEGLDPNSTYHYRVVADNGIDADGDPVAPGVHEVRGADVSFATRSSVPAPGGRAFELVTPAAKWGGQGVGFWPSGLGSLGSAGVAAYHGERFAAQAQYGSTLSGDGGFSHSNDWVFAERTSDQLGWLSRSPLTHPNYKTVVGQNVGLAAAAEDLSATYWRAPSSLAFFPEMLLGGDPANDRPHWHQFAAGQMADWGGFAEPTRWELFGPADLSQVTDDSLLGLVPNLALPAFSSDGSAAVATTELGTNNLPQIHGLAGPGDPTWPTPAIVPGAPAYGDLLEGGSIYFADLSSGLADSFAGTGERELLNVCTGSGPERTEIPRVGGGDLGAQACPDGTGGRERLISRRGAAFNSTKYVREDVVSAGGHRTFFLSPDPRAPGVPNGIAAACTGSAANTLCAPQLYVSQREPDGTRTTHWISRAQPGLFGTQDATLTGSVRFEGAAEDGSIVYFRTNSPLTADDPNGLGAPTPGGVKTGTPHPSSWDLYAYEFPADPEADLDDGTLTRVSAGPSGTGDCNSPLLHNPSSDTDIVGALRALSDDGSRAYFTCQAPLPGVPAPASSLTSPGGTPTTADQTNLYFYDSNRPQAERWSFVARMPRSSSGALAACASTGTQRRSPFRADTATQPHISAGPGGANCTSASADGAFLTFFTDGRLTADDSPDAVADIYAYDATREELTRVTAPQGGPGGSYPCAGDFVGTTIDESLLYSCRGDGGMDEQNGVQWSGPGVPHLGLASEPAGGERIAFFNSALRLVAEDQDDGYDVYEWREGELSLITPGDPASEDALYKGNSADGKNLYFVTRQALTWQDTDVVADVYTARVGGGIPEPLAPPACAVLADACQGALETAPVPTDSGSSSFAGQGNLAPKPQSKPCPKGKVRKGDRCVKKKAKTKKKAAKNRAKHDRRAGR